MKKVVKLTEKDLTRIVNRVISENKKNNKENIQEMENFFNPEAMSTGGAIITMALTVIGLLGFAGFDIIRETIQKLRKKGQEKEAKQLESLLAKKEAEMGDDEELYEF